MARSDDGLTRRRQRLRPMRIALVSLGAVALVLAAGFVATRLKVFVAERSYPPIGAFVSAGAVDLHYLRRGSGLTVVLLHGRDGTLQEFTLSVFDRLAEHYDVIAFDRPGYGYSERPAGVPLGIDVQARLLREVLQALGVERPILVGHSYGGAVVLRYLVDFPEHVRGAVSLAGVAYVDEPPRGGLLALPTVPVIGTSCTTRTRSAWSRCWKR